MPHGRFLSMVRTCLAQRVWDLSHSVAEAAALCGVHEVIDRNHRAFRAISEYAATCARARGPRIVNCLRMRTISRGRDRACHRAIFAHRCHTSFGLEAAPLCYDPTDPGARSERSGAEHVPIVQRPRTWPFQGQNTGSNPVGDATIGAIRPSVAACTAIAIGRQIGPSPDSNFHQAPCPTNR